MDYIKNFVVMRAPMEGGEPQVVTETYAPGEMLGDVGFGISTDGKQLVFLIVRSGGGGQVPGIFVMDLDGGEERHKRVECDARISGVPRFTPDGSAVAYPIRSNQVDNLWLQPLDGRGDGRLRISRAIRSRILSTRRMGSNWECCDRTWSRTW